MAPARVVRVQLLQCVQGAPGGRTVRAFANAGRGWGGAWAGDTKDYMHFSFNGR